MKKALPVGVENFEDIVRTGYYYVDKTLLIKELLDLKGKDGMMDILLEIWRFTIPGA